MKSKRLQPIKIPVCQDLPEEDDFFGDSDKIMVRETEDGIIIIEGSQTRDVQDD